jgi:hypothetical protein
MEAKSARPNVMRDFFMGFPFLLCVLQTSLFSHKPSGSDSSVRGPAAVCVLFPGTEPKRLVWVLFQVRDKQVFYVFKMLILKD